MDKTPIIMLSLLLFTSSYFALISNEGSFDIKEQVSESDVISHITSEPTSDGTRATLYVDDSGGQTYRTIQSAVNAANPGDTIFVYPGTYIEQVIINKALSVTGSGVENTLIAGDEDGNVVKITANGVEMSGFTVTGTGSNPTAGSIFLDGVTGCRIENNSCRPAYYVWEGEIFNDNFEDGNLAPWTKNGHGGVGTHTHNSGSRSMYLYYDTTYMTSPNIDLSSALSATLNCWVRRGSDAFSENPDEGENLLIQYRNQGGSYSTLRTLSGDGTPGQTYQLNFNLPGAAFHAGFRIRFYLTDGSRGNYDYWHVDDVKVRGPLNQLSVPASGIILDSSHNNIIRNNNCSSTDGKGMGATDSNDNSIDNNTFENNPNGIYISNSHRNTIADNQCNSNSDQGIHLAQSNDNVLRTNNCSDNEQGIYLSNSDRNAVFGNDCNSNDVNGIRFIQSDDGSLENNNCSHNEFGIDILNSDGNTVARSFCSFNDLGIDMENSDNNNILNNTCDSNREKGIKVKTSANNDIRGNICSGSIDGLNIQSGNSNTIEHNDLFDNQHGILLDNTDNCAVENNSCSDNDDGIRLISSQSNGLGYNNCTNNTMYGVYLLQSDNNLITKSNCSKNIVYGIYLLQSDNNLITMNNCTDNSDSGIFLDRSSDNEFTLNHLHHNGQSGLELHEDCDDNIVSYNSVCENGKQGIKLLSSKGDKKRDNRGELSNHNSFHHNDFVDNYMGGQQAYDGGQNNTWDDGIGEGNFWYDYRLRNPIASNNDHIWNISYVIHAFSNTTDRYPLVYAGPGIDTIPPKMIVDDTPMQATTGDPFTFSAEFRDNLGIIVIKVLYSYDNIDFTNRTMGQVGQSGRECTVFIEPNATIMYYQFYIRDAGSNGVFTDITTVEVLDNDDPELEEDLTRYWATTGDPFPVIMNVTDNVGIDLGRAYCGYTFNDVDYFSELMISNNSTFNITIDIPTDAQFVKYSLNVSDTSDNWFNKTFPRVYVDDNDPPVLMGDESQVTNVTTGDDFIISASFEDNIEVWSAYVRYSFMGGEEMNDSMEPGNGSNWSKTIAVIPNATSLNYSFHVLDAVGNHLNTGTFNRSVMDNDLPIPRAGADMDMEQRDVVSFNASKTTDNIGISEYYWTFDYNGTEEKLFGMSAEFTFNIIGSYAVILTVRDEAGNIDTDSINITVRAIGSGVDDTGNEDDDDAGNEDDDDPGTYEDDDDDTGKGGNTPGSEDVEDSSIINTTAYLVIALFIAVIVIIILFLMFIVMWRRNTRKDGTETIDGDSQDDGRPVESPLERADETEKYTCADCGAELRFVDRYGQWWCDYCQKYSGESTPDTLVDEYAEGDITPFFTHGYESVYLPPSAPKLALPGMSPPVRRDKPSGVSLPRNTDEFSSRLSSFSPPKRLALPRSTETSAPDRRTRSRPIPDKPKAKVRRTSTVPVKRSVIKTRTIKNDGPTIPPVLLENILTDESSDITTPNEPQGTTSSPFSLEDDTFSSIFIDSLFELPPREKEDYVDDREDDEESEDGMDVVRMILNEYAEDIKEDDEDEPEEERKESEIEFEPKVGHSGPVVKKEPAVHNGTLNCHSCGGMLRDNDKFCKDCGTPVGGQQI